jgi:hypothetical protein
MKKPLSSFWVLCIVFILALVAIVLLSIMKIGILVATGIVLLFSVLVYRLPSFVYREGKRYRTRLTFACTVGSVFTFVCMAGLVISFQDIKSNSVIDESRVRMFQCVLVASYLSIALIVSKLYEKEEKSRYSSSNPTKSHPVYK